jgi:hypothetical protein
MLYPAMPLLAKLKKTSTTDACILLSLQKCEVLKVAFPLLTTILRKYVCMTDSCVTVAYNGYGSYLY